MVNVDILMNVRGAQLTQKQEENGDFLFTEWKVPTETRLHAIDLAVVSPRQGGRRPQRPLHPALHVHVRGPEHSLARNDVPGMLRTGNCDWARLYVKPKHLKCRKLFIRFMKTLVTGIESCW